MMDLVIRRPKEEECDALVQMGERTGIFAPGEAQELLGQTLISLFDEKLPLKHQALVLEHGKLIKGWAYFGPLPESPDIWNLWWIGVDPQFIAQGFGKKLLLFVEDAVKSDGASHLVIETSSSNSFVRTREFYKLQGYGLSQEVPDYYGPGENKMFAKE